MAKYKTIRREQILGFLSQKQEKAFTVTEIANGISGTLPGATPSISTVYRHIKQFVDDGKVKRIVNANSREFLYQLADHESRQKHLHMKCSVCGKLFHIDNELSQRMIDELFEKQGFCLDRSIVLTGICKDCK